MACDKTNCVISLGLTIMDRYPECERQERAAEEAVSLSRLARLHFRADATNHTSLVRHSSYRASKTRANVATRFC